MMVMILLMLMLIKNVAVVVAVPMQLAAINTCEAEPHPPDPAPRRRPDCTRRRRVTQRAAAERPSNRLRLAAQHAFRADPPRAQAWQRH
eukprot:2852805-Pleurochrysis_carterae.AAC.3